MMDKLINVTGLGLAGVVALLFVVLWMLDRVLKETAEVHDHMRVANTNISYVKSKINSMEEKQKHANNNGKKKSHTYELKQVDIKPKERTKAEPIDLMTEADIPSFFRRGDR